VSKHERSDGRRYRLAGSNRYTSAIYERILIEFVARWPVQPTLINYSVETGLCDNIMFFRQKDSIIKNYKRKLEKRRKVPEDRLFLPRRMWDFVFRTGK
jgi:hypothetical protein